MSRAWAILGKDEDDKLPKIGIESLPCMPGDPRNEFYRENLVISVFI